MDRARTLWDSVWTSFWFVPSLMIVLAAGLAPFALWLDRVAGAAAVAWPGIYRGEADAARDLFATLLTAMMTMASLIFSITMVVLTLAASQFGPRLIRNFMASRQTQIVLGTYVMTIVYCLLGLALMGGRGGGGVTGWPSVSLAVVFVLVSVALLAVFLHGLARSIMSETVIRRVGAELDALIRGLGPLRALPDLHPERHLPAGFHAGAAWFGPSRAGYIRAIAFDRVVAAAGTAGCIVGLQFRAGDFVTADGGGIAVFPAAALSPQLETELRRAVVTGPDRTPVQDVAFSIRHLVEIAVRALSPSLNDPYTAVAALDQLSASLSLLLRRELPPGAHRDRQGVVRAVCPVATHASLIATAFDQIRQNGAAKTHVALHLLEAISRIAPHARLVAQTGALAAQVGQIATDAARLIANRADLEVVSQRAAEVQQELAAHHARCAAMAWAGDDVEPVATA